MPNRWPAQRGQCLPDRDSDGTRRYGTTTSDKHISLGPNPSVLSGRSSLAVQCLSALLTRHSGPLQSELRPTAVKLWEDRREEEKKKKKQTRGRSDTARRTEQVTVDARYFGVPRTERKSSREMPLADEKKHCLSEARPPALVLKSHCVSAAEQGRATEAGGSVAPRRASLPGRPRVGFSVVCQERPTLGRSATTAPDSAHRVSARPGAVAERIPTQASQARPGLRRATDPARPSSSFPAARRRSGRESRLALAGDSSHPGPCSGRLQVAGSSDGAPPSSICEDQAPHRSYG